MTKKKLSRKEIQDQVEAARKEREAHENINSMIRNTVDVDVRILPSSLRAQFLPSLPPGYVLRIPRLRAITENISI